MTLTYNTNLWSDQRVLELQSFCQGAQSMNGDNFEWSFNTETDEFSVFTSLEHMKASLEVFFGKPDKIEPY